MPIKLMKGDITKVKADAIVNAANNELTPGCGVCGAIFGAAGCAQLEWACRAVGHCDTGAAVITDGFALPAGQSREVRHPHRRSGLAGGWPWGGGSAPILLPERCSSGRTARLPVLGVSAHLLRHLWLSQGGGRPCRPGGH